MIKNEIAVLATLVFAGALACAANAATIPLTFAGPGVSGTLTLTYGPATDLKYPEALEITSVTGTFTDQNNGLNLVDVPIVGLVPITHDTPEPTNLLAPNDFSRFAVATGLAPVSNGFLTYDNLYWPKGSPQTASDYPLHGGVLDIYGLMLDIGGARVVDFWSNGTPNGAGTGPIYGVAVATHAAALDYVSSGVTVTPEPDSIGLVAIGLFAVVFLIRRRRSARMASV